MTPAQFAKVVQQQQRAFKKNISAAARANAELTGSRIREHIVRDDLPLTALSPEWIEFKLSEGRPRNHLWWTGEYLSNFDVIKDGLGFSVGTSRSANSFPSGQWDNLPELLEHRFPVWQLTLDEIKPDIAANYAEATRAMIAGTTPQFKTQ